MVLAGAADWRNGRNEVSTTRKRDASHFESKIMTPSLSKPPLHVLLASPRGFCAGVSRAIEIVENALATYGAPVFVRHEIVHNTHVVKRLSQMGAVFVDEVDQALPNRPIIFSAHGSPAKAYEQAKTRGSVLIDAACPLVLKVHAQVKRFISQGRHVVVIGHEGHPEVEGVVGQAGSDHFTLIETVAQAQQFQPGTDQLAYVTQTTLSVDDTKAIIDVIRSRFPTIASPSKADICYATSNRQDAVKAIAGKVKQLFVIGSPTSSNSQRLVETALRYGAQFSTLIDNPKTFNTETIHQNSSIGITAGASAPETLVEEFLTRLAQKFSLTIETVETARETTVFKTPQLKQAS